MPFGLKNAGATYQRLVDKAFDRQIGRNLEIYVDNLVIKSYTKTELLRDIEETFCTLRKIKMKLNPKKCTFGATEGMFLGYMISPEGIKLCPNKTEVVLQLPSPRTIKEVQSLNGKLASLNRFLSKSAEKSLPLFKTLNKCIKKTDFQAEPDFNPDIGLFRELSATSSRAKLYPNGKASPGASLRHQKVTQILPGASHWEHNITYRPRTSVKGQILADFLVEKPDDAPLDASMIETPQEPWTLFTDGSSCVDGSGAGLILISPKGTEFIYALRFQFAAFNNEAEYEALIAGLQKMGVRNVQVPRSKNKKADALSKIASTSFAHLSKQVLVEILKEKSIQEKEVAAVVEEEGPTWMTSIIEYLRDETLSDDRKEASKLRIKARQYELLDWILSRRSFLKPWLRCVGPLQADYVIREIHEGSCSPRKVKFLIVAMDYFTKWIEAKAVATISGSQVKKFVWDNIVCRFGLPGEIISDNDKQFSGDPFKDWCEKLNIVHRFTSVKHPQSNRLVEWANRSLGEGVKAHLDERNKN
ncbi:reverse transcriptase domain-containing protein [Tanacetum coccineum]